MPATLLRMNFLPAILPLGLEWAWSMLHVARQAGL